MRVNNFNVKQKMHDMQYLFYYIPPIPKIVRVVNLSTAVNIFYAVSFSENSESKFVFHKSIEFEL